MYRFEYDERLGISIPDLEKSLSDYNKATQEEILLRWEEVRGNIPERIFELEKEINLKQALLNNEANFEQACDLNTKISILASTINDLWLWFRSYDKVDEKNHH
ncbi:hypothetical protein RJD24_16595 [Bacillaceae bacterium IKA-2]|nr:hypothetical protein RJD24_16595 [Bacillaceae bacterium IKA-2]